MSCNHGARQGHAPVEDGDGNALDLHNLRPCAGVRHHARWLQRKGAQGEALPVVLGNVAVVPGNDLTRMAANGQTQ